MQSRCLQLQRGVKRLSRRALLVIGLALFTMFLFVSSYVSSYVSQRNTAFDRATTYYRNQLPQIETMANSWKLNSYFELDLGAHGESITWEELITERLGKFATLYREKGLDDFKVEKDKCEMYRFLERNSMPYPPIIGRWSSQKSFHDTFGITVQNLTTWESWPLFLKLCHLTQGSSKSVRMLKSQRQVALEQHDIEEWVDAKWNFRADDSTRPWREAGNALTDNLVPGLILQAPAPSKFDPLVGEAHVFELKVEVFWGRAYIATCPDTRLYDHSSFVTRNNGGEIEFYPGKLANMLKAPVVLPRSSWYYWMVDEGHVDCAWALAERISAVMAVDTVRIDIFLNPNDPKGCMVNENSLSSGMGYGPHIANMARLWSGPHLRKSYQSFTASKRVYQATQADPDFPVPAPY